MLRGILVKDLEAVLDFIYHGETSLFQAGLERFLAVAEELQLKGLLRKDKSENGEVSENMTDASELIYSKQALKRGSKVSKPQELFNLDEHASINCREDKTVALAANFPAGDLQDLDEKVSSLMEKTLKSTADGARRLYACQLCGKEGKREIINTVIEKERDVERSAS